MRYKIAFDLPFFEQEKLLHAHSHFAFGGWICHLLYCGLALVISPFLPVGKDRKYRRIIAANLLCAFGMLAAFTAQGYGMVSVIFSTLTIFIAIVFAVYFIKDAKYLPAAHPSKCWAVTGLVLNVLSSAGPLRLAYMMATQNIDHELYLASVYYYLHFQYNGWFFFGATAIASSHFLVKTSSLKKHFYLLSVTFFLTFFLSLLWAKLPLWLYIITVIAVVLQWTVGISLLRKLGTALRQMQQHYPRWINLFFYAAALALVIKFTLQVISAIPALNRLVFGFRPVVIGYLHLVFLGIYSLFFIGYLFAKGFIRPSKMTKTAALVFLTGVMLNELLLATQGFAAFAYFPIPRISEMLLGAAFLLLCSAFALLLMIYKKQKS